MKTESGDTHMQEYEVHHARLAREEWERNRDEGIPFVEKSSISEVAKATIEAIGASGLMAFLVFAVWVIHRSAT